MHERTVSKVRAILGVFIGLLLLVPAAGGVTNRVRIMDRDPVFSPDGKTIAFVRSGSSSSIMLVGVDAATCADSLRMSTLPIWPGPRTAQSSPIA
jgi:hypothetical protein